VLPLVTSGLLNKQIAAELGISEAATKVHRSQLMRKMKAESMPDLMWMAEKLGFVRGAVLKLNYSKDCFTKSQ
jgi:FixJ family two-component response regulator